MEPPKQTKFWRLPEKFSTPPNKPEGAKFSEDKKHRFVLWRIWDKSKPCCLFIGLNPSTAGAGKDDHTTRLMKGFAKRWGLGGYYLCNLFSCVSLKPKGIVDRHGKLNRAWIKRLARRGDMAYVVACWGGNPRAKTKSALVGGMLAKHRLYCIEETKARHPGHPRGKKYGNQKKPKLWRC